MTMTPAVPTAPAESGPATETTPQCTVGQLYEPGWRDGCPACKAPGYEHPVLGWMDIPCACPHHTEGLPS